MSMIADWPRFRSMLTFADPRQLRILASQLPRGETEARQAVADEIRRRALGGQQAQVLKPLAGIDTPGGLHAEDMVNPPPGGQPPPGGDAFAGPVDMPAPTPAPAAPSSPATPGVALAGDALGLQRPPPPAPPSIAGAVQLARAALAARKPPAPAAAPTPGLLAMVAPQPAQSPGLSDSDVLNWQQVLAHGGQVPSAVLAVLRTRGLLA